ncbi:AT-hook motif nuclear-localized protein 8-like [Hibiscus syriacus]|uniref:AT-hook motif nuclear-localized protein 8-like n=1 Tax=Hibiscus syriacus TaxID=106335 RepID=UPI001923CB0C|nr:AT-hook motif nuclear-localized protein 8-like [Hibiscus syriacus]
MESREVQAQASAGMGFQPQQAQPMVIGPTSSSYPSNSTFVTSNLTANIPPSSAHCFSFNHLALPPSHNQYHLQQFHNQNQQQLRPFDSLNSLGFDGSPQFQYNAEPGTMRKKRGRPRKYASDGDIALQLAPTTPIATHSANHGGGSDSFGLGSVGAAVEQPPRRNRGRPPGSGKGQIDALGGVSGMEFTPHVITVNAGEDVASKITAFSQQGQCTVCVLSANGAVCDVTLGQPGGMEKYEGRLEIISLSGSFLVSENNGSCSRSGGLNVSLVGPDGRVVGGGVAGILRAVTPVQVIVGSFIADVKKQNLDVLRTEPSFIPTPNMQNFGAPGTAGSSPLHAGSSESSGEKGGSALNGGSEFYNNSVPPSMLNNDVQMNSHWTGHTQQ